MTIRSLFYLQPWPYQALANISLKMRVHHSPCFLSLRKSNQANQFIPPPSSLAVQKNIKLRVVRTMVTICSLATNRWLSICLILKHWGNTSLTKTNLGDSRQDFQPSYNNALTFQGLPLTSTTWCLPLAMTLLKGAFVRKTSWRFSLWGNSTRDSLLGCWQFQGYQATSISLY